MGRQEDREAIYDYLISQTVPRTTREIIIGARITNQRFYNVIKDMDDVLEKKVIKNHGGKGRAPYGYSVKEGSTEPFTVVN